MSQEILCPVCNQDLVHHVRIASGADFHWCGECDSVWLSQRAIAAETGEYLVNVFGRCWSEIEPIGG